jgi:adenylylsulfate kinase-like enzyme
MAQGIGPAFKNKTTTTTKDTRKSDGNDREKGNGETMWFDGLFASGLSSVSVLP